MYERENRIFRTAVLKRLLAPDEVNDLLSISGPLDWLVLVGVSLVISAALIWAVEGTLPVTVSGEGVLQDMPGGRSSANASLSANISAGSRMPVPAELHFQCGNRALHAVMFVPESAATQVRRGLPVQLALPAFPPQQYGFLNGTVSSIDSSPASDSTLQQILGRDPVVRLCVSRDLRIRVDVLLDGNGSGGQWSHRSSVRPQLSSGAVIDGEITLRRERPIARLLPRTLAD